MPKRLLFGLKFIIAFSFVGALLLWINAHYSWSELFTPWLSVPIVSIVAISAAVFLSHFVRVIRIHRVYALKQKFSLPDVAAISLVHNTVSFLLPMRLGELALPILSKQKLKLDFRYSAACLLLVRLMDAHVLIALVLYFAGSIWLDKTGLWLCVAFLVLSPAAFPIARLLLLRSPKFSDVGELLSSYPALIQLYLLTACIWLIKLAALATLVSNLGAMDIDHAWLASIIADASALSPITGIANAGTFEAAFALPLLPLGYTNESLVKIALNLHVFVLATNIIAGLAGLLLFLRKH